MRRYSAIWPLALTLAACGPMIEKRFFPKPRDLEMAREVVRLGQTVVTAKSNLAVSQG